MSYDEIAAIRARAEAATPGPWKFDSCSLTDWHDQTFTMEWIDNCGTGKPGSAYERERRDADGRFIAAARTDVPRLLAEVARLRAVETAGILSAQDNNLYSRLAALRYAMGKTT